MAKLTGGQAAVEALKAEKVGHVFGLIGSATKRARFEKRLAEGGIARERIAGLVCPIGVGGIRSKLPAVIAAATAAELLVRDEALRAASHGEAPARLNALGRMG